MQLALLSLVIFSPTAIGLIVAIGLIALLLWLVPMNKILRNLLIAVAVVLFVLWVLSIVGALDTSPHPVVVPR